MIRRVHITETGGPEVLKIERADLPDPGPGEARVRHTAIGLNYIDTYHRTGLYPLPLPTGLGVEAAGEVVAIGEGVNQIKPGDRVVYFFVPGAYADEVNIPAERLVILPDTIEEDEAAAGFLKGMTAEYLLRRTYPVKSGETILVHAAAGGVGLILCQWAKRLGCTVIGTAGSEEKAELAKAHGADHVILYRSEDFVARTRELTGGEGVPVVYDSVGKDTVPGSAQCLQPRGMLVSYGNASGMPAPIGFEELGARGSLFVTRPSLFNYVATRSELDMASEALFEQWGAGHIKVEVRQTYPLDEVRRAHEEMEARSTLGSSVLVP